MSFAGNAEADVRHVKVGDIPQLVAPHVDGDAPARHAGRSRLNGSWKGL